MTSDSKVSANRRNAQKSCGPRNTSSTRFNATKHGLLAAGITELDDADGYKDTLRRLGETYLDELDAFLVERIALCIVRLRRTARLEAEFLRSILHPPTYGDGLLDLTPLTRPSVIDPGLPASIESEGMAGLVTFQRYESSIENKLFRTMHELERIRRSQGGEYLPVPDAVDVGVYLDPDVDANASPPKMVSEELPPACTERTDKAGPTKPGDEPS